MSSDGSDGSSGDGVFDNILQENSASRTLAPKAVAIQFILMSCFSVRVFTCNLHLVPDAFSFSLAKVGTVLAFNVLRPRNKVSLRLSSGEKFGLLIRFCYIIVIAFGIDYTRTLIMSTDCLRTQSQVPCRRQETTKHLRWLVWLAASANPYKGG